MQSLGEMATWLPLPGAIPQFCARYVDGAMGFAVGWNVSLRLEVQHLDSILIQQTELVPVSNHTVRRNLSSISRYSILERSGGH